jgi:hypothetical protein
MLAAWLTRARKVLEEAAGPTLLRNPDQFYSVKPKFMVSQKLINIGAVFVLPFAPSFVGVDDGGYAADSSTNAAT